MDTLSYNVVIGFLVSYFIQWLKKQAWFPWITQETKKLNFWLSGAIAAIAALGITIQFDKAAGILTVTGLTLANIGVFAWELVKQWLATKAAYDAVIAKTPNGKKVTA